MDLEKINKIAQAAALEAGAIARQRFANPGPINPKGYRDVITEVDHAAQACITGMVRKAFPDHAFLTEEEDASLPGSGPVTWIIDPLDGTINYSRKIPLYCVSIAAAQTKPGFTEDDLLVGVIYDPVRDELFSATRDGPALLNNQVLQTSAVGSLEEADIAYDWHRTHDIRERTLGAINRLIHDVKSARTLNTAALAMAWVAAGRLDAYFNYILYPWDIAAASLLVRQAGGKTANIAGGPVDFHAESTPFLASNGRIDDRLRQRL